MINHGKMVDIKGMYSALQMLAVVGHLGGRASSLDVQKFCNHTDSNSSHRALKAAIQEGWLIRTDELAPYTGGRRAFIYEMTREGARELAVKAALLHNGVLNYNRMVQRTDKNTPYSAPVPEMDRRTKKKKDRTAIRPKRKKEGQETSSEN